MHYKNRQACGINTKFYFSLFTCILKACDKEEHYPTVGGLVSHAFGKIPEVGDSEECYGYLFTILKKTEQNIETIKLELVINKSDMVDVH